jgi:hypothetical protein
MFPYVQVHLFYNVMYACGPCPCSPNRDEITTSIPFYLLHENTLPFRTVRQLDDFINDRQICEGAFVNQARGS